MTPRPSFTSKRPLSAIFLGNPSNSQIPDLPDPPLSPSSSSGLPSPPATNSTGSGSTGDASTNVGSVRRPLTSEARLTMYNDSSSSNDSSQRRSRASSEEGDDDNGEDHTAKLSDDRRLSLKALPSENASALQRVKSLTQRNRMVLDKLASISSGSRLSTPSPPNALRHARSSVASSSTSSSVASSRVAAPNTRRRREDSASGMSGSETERERVLSTSYSSDDLSATPPSTSTVPFRSESVRQRRISAPDSPARVFTSVFKAERGESPAGPSLTPRKRAAMTDSSEGSVDDVATAALAAVASSRRSPPGGKKRQPLPKEFRDRRSLDGKWLAEPSTPHRNSDRTTSPGVHVGRGSPSPRSYAATLNESPQSPRPRSQRYSTVRDMARRHQTRWLSQDMSSVPDEGLDDDRERKQTRRAGSSESPLSANVGGGRSVVGESLRAAGLAKRREGTDDVFSGESELQSARRRRLSGSLGTRPSLVDGPAQGSRVGDGSVFTREPALMDPRTPPLSSQSTQRLANRNASSGFSTRPATSMASYHEEPRTAPPLLRSHKSSYPMHERESQGVISLDSVRPPSQAQSRNQSQTAPNDRTYTSPSTIGRRTTMTPLNLGSGSGSTPEHARLMLDSLSMFESHLARLPSMGTTTTVTVPDLFRSAQNIVHSANTLNGLLRNGTSHALEEQIEAEVGDGDEPVDPLEIWRTVGGEYRESLRVSDELVRTMTSFLLGVGKLLRETTPGPIQHARGSSLDDTTTRRQSPDLAVHGGRTSAEGVRASNGRNNAEVRRSWEPAARDREESIRRAPSRAELFSSRPPTALNHIHDQDLHREVDHSPDQERTTSRSSLTTRRLFTPRESREQILQKASPMTASTSEETVQGYEPSPTPAVRHQIGERRRALPPIAVPPPLQTLPSESLLTRNSSSSRSVRRNKVSTTSNATVRANSIFPSISTTNPTTAVTTTSASASPEHRPAPQLRGEASRSTISRSNTVSGAALAGLQQQYDRDGRKRTISSTSATEGEASAAPPMSGSETERDTRRTINSRVRQSLDGNPGQEVRLPIEKRERRRTVTDIFSRA